MKQFYNFKNIFTLLDEGFSLTELKNLCFTEDVLRPFYEQWSPNANKNDLIRELIEYANQRIAIEPILAWAKKQNPARYQAHEPYLSQDDDTDQPIATLLDENYLGYGIKIGGAYRGVSLQAAATDWTNYGATKVRSGWLFAPQLTNGHAVTFFKIHLLHDGRGYIHIVDVSSPAHPVYLSTRTGFNKQEEFHYLSKPTDVWQFTWAYSDDAQF